MNLLVASLALIPLERILNTLLQQDSLVRQKLARFSGKTLEIDWQDQLAFLVGDVATHQLDQFVKNAASWSQQARASTKYNVREYLMEETHSVPNLTEVENFHSNLDQLKLRIDRLTARKERLNSRLMDITENLGS